MRIVSRAMIVMSMTGMGRMRIVTTMAIMTSVIIMLSVVSHLTVFFFAELICLVPCRLDKYLQCRVQVYDEYKEDECDDGEYDQEKYLHRDDGKERDDGRYREWDHEEYESDHDRAEVEQYHREVELARDGDMAECHTSRLTEGNYCRLMLEYDKKLRIRETHVQKEGEYEIYTHDDTDGWGILYAKKSKKQYIERDDRERTEHSSDVVHFEYREEVSESIEESLYRTVCSFSVRFAISVDHLDDPTVGYRFEYHIEYEYRNHSYDNFGEVVCMGELREYWEDLIFFLEYIDVCERDLIDEDHEEPEHPDKRR